MFSRRNRFDLWESPPFELTQRDGKAYGRGIGDDKGHIVTRLAALDAVRAVTGEYPTNIKFVIEGEEEIGSPNLPPFIDKHADKLAADACLWEFGSVDDEDRPIQFLGMRGICYVELVVRTAVRDAHSGMVGSVLENAAWRLTWALSTLKDREEHIRIDGFYDNAHPPTDRDMELLAAIPEEIDFLRERYEVDEFLNGMTGGAEFRKAQVFVPTCTINGIKTGYQDEGAKTVLPAEALAKIDFRLIPDQTPEEVVDQLRTHLDSHGFEDIEIRYLGGGRPARTDPDHPFIKLVDRTAEEAFGKPIVSWPMVGGSGPNYPFVHVLNLPVAMAGISHPDGRAHAPNENIRLDLFNKGIKHSARIMLGFGEMH